MYFFLQLFLFNLLAIKLCVVSYVHLNYVCHLNCTIVSIYKTMDHILTLSTRDLASKALDFRYTSLHLQDFVIRFDLCLIEIYFIVIALFSKLNI